MNGYQSYDPQHSNHSHHYEMKLQRQLILKDHYYHDYCNCYIATVFVHKLQIMCIDVDEYILI